MSVHNNMNGASRFARGLSFRLTVACNLQCKMCRLAYLGEEKFRDFRRG